MKVQLLGTGAADGIPGFYGDNEVCRWARKHKGKDIRTRSSAIIDEGIKIDLPPETLIQLTQNDLTARDWSALFFTHSHEDHLAVSEIQYCLYPFNEMEELGFTIFGNAEVIETIKARYPKWPIEYVYTKVFTAYQHAAYSVTPVRANHKEDEECHNLLFEKNGTKFLYGTDTGFWSDETFEFLSGYRLSGLVLEATDGFVNTPYEGHLDLEGCFSLVERLFKQGTLDSGSRIVTTHHSHQGGGRHCDLEAACTPKGIEVGYDGMVLNL